jgi:hypothetical protein
MQDAFCKKMNHEELILLAISDVTEQANAK